MFICVTEIDSKTKILCTQEPMRNGPSLPEIKGLVLDWADLSTWPVETNNSGVLLRAPKYYGTCDDDAATNVSGMLDILTQEEYRTKKHDEFFARKPFNSWIWDAETFTWSSPISYPNDGGKYMWDEPSISWQPVNAPKIVG